MNSRITLAERAAYGLPVVATEAIAEPQKPATASKARKAKTAKPKPPTEYEEQVMLFQWANAHPDKRLQMLFAIPNGAKLSYGKNRNGQRFSKEAMRLLASGLKSGVPDILLPCPSKVNHAWKNGLFIEMKRVQKSLSKVAPEQLAWKAALEEMGYRVEICYGWEAARDVILNYLGGK